MIDKNLLYSKMMELFRRTRMQKNIDLPKFELYLQAIDEFNQDFIDSYGAIIDKKGLSDLLCSLYISTNKKVDGELCALDMISKFNDKYNALNIDNILDNMLFFYSNTDDGSSLKYLDIKYIELLKICKNQTVNNTDLLIKCVKDIGTFISDIDFKLIINEDNLLKTLINSNYKEFDLDNQELFFIANQQMQINEHLYFYFKNEIKIRQKLTVDTHYYVSNKNKLLSIQEHICANYEKYLLQNKTTKNEEIKCQKFQSKI